LVVLGAALVGAAMLGASSTARAFSNPIDYGRYPDKNPGSLGGGAGRYFTGSPADGYSCNVCHSSTRSNYSFPLEVKGLPVNGYVPGQTYKIELISQAAIDAYNTSAQTNTGATGPMMTMVAELMAEDGGPSGTIAFPTSAELNPAQFPRQWCPSYATAAPDALAEEYGMNLYVNETASLSTELTLANSVRLGDRCTVGRGTDEMGQEYERRCIVALKPCGAQTVKFLWTAPEAWRAPIYFSAGLVMTYSRSNAPDDDDFVTTLSIPLNPAFKGPVHETVLTSGCSVALPSARTSHGLGVALLGALGLLLVRSRQRRKLATAVLGLALALVCVACEDGPGLVTNLDGTVGNVGAFEQAMCSRRCTAPFVCRDSAWPDAGSPEEAAKAASEAGNSRGSAPSTTMMMTSAAGAGAAGAGAPVPGGDAPAGPAVETLGSVNISFTSANGDLVSDYAVRCAPCSPHYVAVWLEDPDEKHVRTLKGHMGTYAGLTLRTFNNRGADCQVPTEVVPVDATSMATLFQHGTYNFLWDGTYGSGHKAAKAGTYVLRIEVAIDEVHWPAVTRIPFVFGDPAPKVEMFPAEQAHTGVTLTYTPTPPSPSP
jgi:hypothetical protein